MRIHLPQENHTIYHSLKGLLDLLPGDQFIQIHRSYIINFSRITVIEGNTVKLGKTELSIGKIFREEFLDRVKSASIGVSSPKQGADRKDGVEH